MPQLAAIEIKGVSRTFPGVKALSELSFAIERGTIHGLAGENGSGKSTLLRLIAGLDRADSGEIRVNGHPVNDVKAAMASRVAMVSQEPSLVDSLTVAENIALGAWGKTGFFVSRKQQRELAEAQMRRLGLRLRPEWLVGRLPPHDQQMTAIARALASGPDILLLDEATSSLTDDQTECLFRCLDECRSAGMTIVFISHKLKEYLRLCDRITVLRDSEYICELAGPGLEEEHIVQAMVGRQLSQYFPAKPETLPEKIALRLERLRCENVKQVSMSVRQGEIMALAGLVGCGRSELLRALYGVMPFEGTLELFGRRVRPTAPSEAVRLGLAFIPAERKAEGIVGRLSVKENAMLSLRLSGALWHPVRHGNESRTVDDMIATYRIKTASMQTSIETLSGGNQQKVILARCISADPRIVLMDEPTRGIDVGAKAEIYKWLRQLTENGMTVIVSSSDLQEVLGIADRVAVMFRGQLQTILDKEDMTEDRIMYYATGNRE